MSKADDGLRKLFQTHLPRPSWLWTPLETGGTHNGVPDSHYRHTVTRASGFLEVKATEGWAVTVRPHQVSWIRSHVDAGERVLVGVRARGAGSANGLGDALWLLHGDCIEELQEHGLKLPESFVLGRWYGGPRTWDWAAITRLLTA